LTTRNRHLERIAHLTDHPAPIDPTTLDPTHPAADDFFEHVNRTWLAANPVPAEYPLWGAFVEINVRNEELLHDILESAAAEPGPGGTTRQRVGDYFASGMDEHSPSQFRVNDPHSNFPAFAEAFDVQSGSPMARTPDDRIKIW
jgi:putative endopeptidase